MIPPTSIDGTDITGATIDGTDVQEITVDGQTVFTAVPDLPASADHQWLGDEGTGTTVNDVIGSKNLSFTGLNWVSDSDLAGGFGYETDGVNDLGTVSYDVNAFNTLSVFYTIITSENNITLLGWNFAGSFGNVQLAIANGKARTTIGDGSQNNFVPSSTTINDGVKHRVGYGFDENNELFVSVDGTIENTTSFGTLGPAENTFAVGGDTGGERVNCIFDNGIAYNDIGSALVTTDYNLQPWS